MKKRKRSLASTNTPAKFQNSVRSAVGEENLETYSETITHIADTFPLLLASFDRTGRCLFVNEGAKHLLNTRDVEPEKLTSLIEDCMGQRGSWLQALEDSLTTKKPLSFDLTRSGDNSLRIFATLKVHGVEREPGEREARLLAFDISHSHNSHVPHTASEFGVEHQIALVAHELRNPLSSVQSGLKILDGEPSEERAKFARASMRDQLHLVTRLINDLLDTSRIKSGQLRLSRTPIAAQSIVELALQICGERVSKSGVRVTVGISSAQKTVNADGQRLAQVVANLIDNALKFTPSGGAVTIEAQERESELEIRVSDSGIGLSQEAQASLFRPFAQVEEARALSPKGLGLGLFIAKSIVEAHGGRLEVASAGRHKGTVFSVFVPLEVEQVIGN